MNIPGSPALDELAIPATIRALVLMSAVIALAAVIARTALQHRADARHSLWLCTLAWVLISPVVSLLTDRSGLAIATLKLPMPEQPVEKARGDYGIGIIASDTEDAALELDAPSGAKGPSGGNVMSGNTARGESGRNDSTDGEHPAPKARTAMPRGRAILAGMVVVWLIGVLAGLARILRARRHLAILSRHTLPLDRERHAGVLARVREGLGVATLPRIVTSPAAREPVAIGLLRPQVVLPEGLAEEVPGAALRDILVHECAHILRGDTRIGLLQWLLGVVYWPHPLVHHANRQLARAREEVCDNHVIRASDRCGYARTLVALTESCRPAGAPHPAIGFLGARWSLADRVAGLLDPRRIPMTRTPLPMRISLAVAITIVGMAVAAVRLDRTARGDEPSPTQAAAQASAPSAPPATVWQVKGTVVDERDRPVAGASIRYSPGYEPSDGVKTAADGSFTLALSGARAFLLGVVAEADGGARIGLVEFEEPRDPGEIEPLKVVLKPSRPVRVRVEDAGGSPVPGAAVEAVESVFQTHATTDSQGLATLRVAADARVQWVIGLKAGVGFDYFENYRTRPATEFQPLPAEVSLTLNGARTIRIKAVDSTGRPVPGVVFSPWTLLKSEKLNYANVIPSEIVKVAADQRGVASFDWFPAEVPGETFLPRSRGFTCPELPRCERGGPMDIEVRVLRDTPLSGTVRFPDGRPAPGVIIRASSEVNLVAANDLVTARTGPDGSYRMDVPPRVAYMIGVLGEIWVAPSLPNVVVHEGQPRTGLDFTLVRGTLIRGRVTDGPDQRPSVGVQVTLAEQGPLLPKELRQPGLVNTQLRRESTTNREGRYAFRVGPGRYQLAGPPLSGNSPLPIEVKAEPELVHDLALKNSPRATFINGLVVEKTPIGERPVAGAWVYRHVIASSSSPSLADDEGRFRIIRLPGESILYARVRNGMAGFAPCPEKGDTVKVVVAPATTLSGRVVDSDGKPVAGHMVGVAFARDGGDFLKSLHHAFRIDTDEQGRFVVKGVPVGAVGDITVYHRSDAISEPPRTAARFEALDLAPVEIPDLVVPVVRPRK